MAKQTTKTQDTIQFFNLEAELAKERQELEAKLQARKLELEQKKAEVEAANKALIVKNLDKYTSELPQLADDYNKLAASQSEELVALKNKHKLEAADKLQAWQELVNLLEGADQVVADTLKPPQAQAPVKRGSFDIDKLLETLANNPQSSAEDLVAKDLGKIGTVKYNLEKLIEAGKVEKTKVGNKFVFAIKK